MVTGLHHTTKVKLKRRTSHNKIIHQNNLHLSIQFSLDGFSFCVKDATEIVNLSSYNFSDSSNTPQELLIRIKEIFEKDTNLHFNFDSITVIHRNNLNTLVPSPHFKEDNLKNYLRYNVKTFASDYFTFDNIDKIEAKNVYIPFVNINNYLIDHFGDFDFFHHQTLFINKLVSEYATYDTKVFAHFENNLLDIVVLDGKKLHLVNSFEVQTTEDFMYYLLFVYEQLKLDTNKIPFLISGIASKDSEDYKIAYKYIQEVSLLESKNSNNISEFEKSELFLLT